ncbi:putative polynucleotide adenylyltransferase [Helianthus debilis subsp. tardiflorus]
MAAIHVKRDSFFARFKPRLSQLFYHKLVKVGNKPRPPSDKDSVSGPGKIDISKWRKMDSRSLGITRVMVPSSPYTLLKILRSRGFEAYLVGGCVRDLLLNRPPKDFDVITTADLNQIKKQFHRCIIVGRRFPICRVHIKGSVIEVSSFKTLAKDSEEKEKFLVSQMPRGCDKFDLNLWKNSMHRDFTVNSLFFDPLNYKIYDYNNGMKDILELKLRTLVPAHVSFTEDCARILRGLRIAARLGLSFSKDIESAIHKHASSILSLSTFRIMMEMDYMLSYGAAESSLRLLHRFHILKILLPVQAAYISRQTTGPKQRTMMLMKLFSHMDELVSCDQPSTCCLWIGLLAFHQALLNGPQHPFVVSTFGCVLYHQSWVDGLRFARKYCQPLVNFDPETSNPYEFFTDDEVAKKVTMLARRVINSIDVLVDIDTLHKTMSKFSGFPCRGLVFVSKNSAHSAAQLFHVLAHKVETYDKGRSSFEMNHQLLGKGDALETRFALGKIIMNTMGCTVNLDNHLVPPESVHFTPSDSCLRKANAKSSTSQKQNAYTEEKVEDIEILGTSGLKTEGPTSNSKKKKLNTKSSNSKKKNAAIDKEIKDIAATDHSIGKPEEMRVSDSPTQELMTTPEPCLHNGNHNRNEKLPSQLEAQNANEKVNVVEEVEVDQSTTKEQSVNRKEKWKHVLPLSSLFK